MVAHYRDRRVAMLLAEHLSFTFARTRGPRPVSRRRAPPMAAQSDRRRAARRRRARSRRHESPAPRAHDADARNGGDYTLTSTAKDVTQFVDTTLATWTVATDGTTAYNYIGTNVAIDSALRLASPLLRSWSGLEVVIVKAPRKSSRNGAAGVAAVS